MPMISPQTREQIRAASDIVEIVGSYLPLRRAGANFVALCPFHREKSPSFNVSPARQAFHCFGCHKGGDVFRFVQDYENITFVEAVKRLADRAGIALEFDETPGQREATALRDRLRDIHEQITQRWQNALANDAAGQIAREYLERRGVLPDAIRTFRLGYAPDAWDDTVNFARSRGWDLKLVELAGLVIPRDKDKDRERTPAPAAPGTNTPPARHYYDRFRGRLMFPICDEQGRVIGFSGRILQGDEKTAKYVNSPETPIFTKSRVLYGLDKTKRAILDAGAALICEGQLDLIACFSAGVRNIVAPQGTALTPDHLRVLRRYAQEAILCFDSDNAGQKAAARVLDELLSSGLSIRVVTVPAPHDPDSYIKAHGPEAFRQLVSGARDFFEFYLEFLSRQSDLTTDRGRIALLEAMAVALQKTGNEILLDRYAQRTSMVLAAAGGVALSPDAVRKEFRKRVAAAATHAAAAAARAAHQASTPPASRPPTPSQASDHPPADDAPWPTDDDLEAHGTTAHDHLDVAEPEEPPDPPPTAEAWLLKLLLIEDDFAGWLALHLDAAWISHAGIRQIVELRLAHHREGRWESPAAFLGELENPYLRSLVSEALADARKIPTPDVQLADVTTRLRNAWIENEIKRLTLHSALPNLDDAERITLLRQLQELRRLKRSPLVARLADHEF